MTTLDAVRTRAPAAADAESDACDAGVLNGIDMQEWNPEADKKIYQTYSAANLKEGKTANKLALQKELSLAERPDVSLCWAGTPHASYVHLKLHRCQGRKRLVPSSS